MTAVSFAAVVDSTDQLLGERYDLFKAGLSPVDWAQMTKWQRRDLLLRHRMEVRDQVRKIKQDENGFGALLGVVLKRVLGV